MNIEDYPIKGEIQVANEENRTTFAFCFSILSLDSNIEWKSLFLDSWFKAATSKINVIKKKFEENFWRQDKLLKTSFADKKIKNNRKSANFLQIYRHSLQGQKLEVEASKSSVGTSEILKAQQIQKKVN